MTEDLLLAKGFAFREEQVPPRQHICKAAAHPFLSRAIKVSENRHERPPHTHTTPTVLCPEAALITRTSSFLL